MKLEIDYEKEDDGRWIAEIKQIPGVMVYALTQKEAETKVKALAFRVLAERLENGEDTQLFTEASFIAA